MALRDIVDQNVDLAFSIVDSLLESAVYKSISFGDYDPVTDSRQETVVSFDIKYSIFRDDNKYAHVYETVLSSQSPYLLDEKRLLVDAKYFEQQYLNPKSTDLINIDGQDYKIINLKELPLKAAYKFFVKLVK